MSIPNVFAVYSNSPTEPLPALSKEREKIQACFLNGMINQKVLYIAPLCDVTNKDFDNVMEFSHLTIFHYSGHASSNSLLIEEKQFLASQLNNLLKGVTVEVVILNGCSTKGFVKELLRKKGVKAVIATERKIEDTFATEFAIRFYKSLLNGKSLIDAFANGKSVSGEYENSNSLRGLDTGEGDDNQCPFGIYYDENDPVKVNQVENFRLIDSSISVDALPIDSNSSRKIEKLKNKIEKLDQAINEFTKNGSSVALDMLIEEWELPEFDPKNPMAGVLILYDRITSLLNKQYEPIEEIRLLTKFQLFDYKDQREKYSAVIESHLSQGYSTGAFLLHGSRESGLSLLQQRIQNKFDLPLGNDQIDMISISLDAKSLSPPLPNVTSIWQAVGKRVGSQQANEIAKRINEKRLIKPVILVFSGAEKEEINLLILNEFWSEFKTHLQSIQPGLASGNRVLLFVQAISGDGRLSSYDQHVANSDDACIIPAVKRVNQEVIRQWKDDADIAYPYDMAFFQKDPGPHVMEAIKEVCTQLQCRDPKYGSIYKKYLQQYLPPSTFTL